jgi:energy-coupling factor transporter ATP-binding protein EcfA2
MGTKMRLNRAEVQNYKLINATGAFSISDMTCLVGKNESGKTAILQALHRIKPDDTDRATFDVETEYPRQHLFDYKRRHDTHPDNVITTWWELDDADAAWVEATYGADVLTGREVKISKGYDGMLYWLFDIDEAQAVANAIEASDLESAHKKAVASAGTLAGLFDAVQGLDAYPAQETFQSHLGALIPSEGKRNLGMALINHFSPTLPTFVYYANYDALPGQVSLEQLVQLEQQAQLTRPHKIFKALLALVGVTTKEVSESETYEALKAQLEAIGLRLSDEIFEYWSQNRDLEVDFNFDIARPGDPPPFNTGYVFRTRIKNRRHGVSVSFDERSTGFVWFFSFLVWFSQMEREHGERLVLLLDEPGLSLHGTAQADLLRYMREKLASKYQVIYTTHSPFMVDASDLLSVRTVEDQTGEQGQIIGTRVGDDVLSTDAETLFPIRAALGYDITQTLFVGEHSLLVEGPSDLLMLRWASEELTARGRPALDHRWTITPCGGVRKVGSFLSLFGAQKLHIAVLVDYAHGDKGSVRSLREDGLLRDGHVLTADMFVDGQDEADIEDLLGRRLYIEVVNKAYGLSSTQRLKAAKAADAPDRVVKEVEDHFKLLTGGVPEFSHLRPAAHLLEHRAEFAEATGIEDALDRFEKLFAQLNAFLPS